MKVELDIAITYKDMLDYKFYHKYHSFSGICEIILGILLLVAGIYSLLNLDKMNLTFALLAVIFGFVFLVVMPFSLINSSKMAVKKPAFAESMHYEIDSKKITVSAMGESAEVNWDMIYRVKDTGKSILIYFTPTRANIIPKSLVGDKLADLKSVILEGIGQYKAKLK